MDISQIGYFQFNNLIQSRIPMILVNLGVDLSVWYKSIEALHIENVSITGTNEEIFQQIAEKKLPPHYPILIVDNNGDDAKKLVTHLESLGHLNVYSLKNGFAGISKERFES